MNRLELSRISGIRVDDMGGHLRIIGPAVHGSRGVVTGYALPPQSHEDDALDPDTAHCPAAERLFKASHPAYRGAAQALRAIDRWGSEVGAAAADGRLSPDGRREVLIGASRQAVNGLVPVYGQLAKIEQSLSQRHAKLYAPPEADAAATLVDIEARGLFRVLSLAERLQAAALMEEPRHARQLLAVMRSPMPWEDPVTAKISAAWDVHVARERPAETSALAAEEKAAEWSLGLARLLGGLVADPVPNGPVTLDRFELHQMVAPHGAERLFALRPEECQVYAQRAQAMAQRSAA